MIKSCSDNLRHLNEDHQKQVLDYLKYFKSKRHQHLDVIDRAFEEAKETCLLENVFTSSDVDMILNTLQSVLKSNILEELENFCHSSVLFLRQLLLQAEGQKINLYINTAKLDDEILLNNIKDLDVDVTEHISKSSIDALPSSTRNRLSAINVNAVDTNLVMQIKDLQESNKQLEERYKKMKVQMQSVTNENNLLKSQSIAHVANIQAIQSKSSHVVSEEINSLSAQLVACRSELQRVNGEIDAKVSHTRQFQDLKNIVTKKNVQLKNIKALLLQYEPNFCMSDVST